MSSNEISITFRATKSISSKLDGIGRATKRSKSDVIRMILEGELGNTAGATTRGRCDSCKYFREERVGPDCIETTCRRYPPVVIMDGRSSAYPLVLDDDACGEFVAINFAIDENDATAEAKVGGAK